jgi:hypothetical protein
MPKSLFVLWILYGGLFGFALGGSFVASYLAAPAIQQSCASGQTASPDCQSPEERQRATEAALSGYTKGLMIFTGVLAAATIGMGIATIGLYISGRDQIRLARDDFNATHRPWIPITKATLYFGVNWAQGNALTGLNITCKNTGNSPAQRVSLAAAIFPFLANEDIPAELIKLQEAHHTSTPRALIEHTLFPGTGELELPRVFLIPETEIANLKNYYGDRATEMVPVIVGSIEYYFSFGEQMPHYTPFVFHLWLTDTEGVARKAIQLDGRNVEARDMILVPLINAGEST